MRFALTAAALYGGLAPALSLSFGAEHLQAYLFTLSFYAACAFALGLAALSRDAGPVLFPLTAFSFLAPVSCAPASPFNELAAAAPLHSAALTLAFLAALVLFYRPRAAAPGLGGPLLWLVSAFIILGGVWVFFNGSAASF